MIMDIAEYFDAKLAPFVDKFYPLVKTLTNGDKTFPAYYTGRNNYTQIKIDNFNGVAYLRQHADPVANSNDGNELVACRTELNIVYPIKLVFAIPRTKLKNDDEFAEDNLVGDLIRVIASKNSSIKAGLKATRVSVIPGSWSTDAAKVWNEETSGTGTVDINYKLIYGAIDFNVTVDIYADCIKQSCEEECYA